jgi:hypothetical protein
VAGLGVVGRDNFGVFPLRGKLLNVREAKHDQIMKNEEIQNIKKIMGLQHNKDYSDVASLRYGQLMIMTDQVSYCVSGTRNNNPPNVRVGSRRLAYQGTSHQLLGPLLPIVVEASKLLSRVRHTHRPSKFCVGTRLQAHLLTRPHRSQRENNESTFSPFPSTSNGSRRRQMRTNGTPSITRSAMWSRTRHPFLN